MFQRYVPKWHIPNARMQCFASLSPTFSIFVCVKCLCASSMRKCSSCLPCTGLCVTKVHKQNNLNTTKTFKMWLSLNVSSGMAVLLCFVLFSHFLCHNIHKQCFFFRQNSEFFDEYTWKQQAFSHVWSGPLVVFVDGTCSNFFFF